MHFCPSCRLNVPAGSRTSQNRKRAGPGAGVDAEAGASEPLSAVARSCTPSGPVQPGHHAARVWPTPTWSTVAGRQVSAAETKCSGCAVSTGTDTGSGLSKERTRSGAGAAPPLTASSTRARVCGVHRGRVVADEATCAASLGEREPGLSLSVGSRHTIKAVCEQICIAFRIFSSCAVQSTEENHTY